MQSHHDSINSINSNINITYYIVKLVNLYIIYIMQIILYLIYKRYMVNTHTYIDTHIHKHTYIYNVYIFKCYKQIYCINIK